MDRHQLIGENIQPTQKDHSERFIEETFVSQMTMYHIRDSRSVHMLTLFEDKDCSVIIDEELLIYR